MRTFFTSDLHFGHIGMLVFGHRPYATVEDMNKALIDNINATVGERDELYILGDLCMTYKPWELARDMDGIRCRNLFLVRGNHDLPTDKIAHLFRQVYEYKTITRKVDGKKVHLTLSHYPMLEWENQSRGAYMLHGHIHTLKEPGFDTSLYNVTNRGDGMRRYDVGVDANDYTPVALDDIMRFFGGVEPRSLFHRDH